MRKATDSDRHLVSDHNGSGRHDDAAAWIRLASCLMKDERLEEAIDMLHLAIQCDPDNGMAWLGLGKAYFQVGRFPEAKEALTIARHNRAPEARVERYRSRIVEMEEVRARRENGAEQPEVSISEADERRRALLSDGGEVAERE